MDNKMLRSEIQAGFKRVDNELSRFKKMSKCVMYGGSALALLYATDIAIFGLNTANGLSLIGFNSIAGTAYVAQKTITMGRKNLELMKVLRKCDKQIPCAVYTNNDTKQKVVNIMKWAIGLGVIAWVIGRIPTPNFNFLMGAVPCSCMSYKYHLTRKNKHILSAEFPRGVVDEHTR